MKRALITGVTGQDGSYLVPYLLEQGYYVYGLMRPTSLPLSDRLEQLINHSHFELLHHDMTDATSLTQLLLHSKPDEIYNLAAQSHVGISFDMPGYTTHANALGVLYFLEAIRAAGLTHTVRFYQASTSELFGKVHEIPQKETTPFYPRSPYAISKLYAYWIVKNYRESYGMFACNGILFNHESPRRGETFVTRKITQAVAARALGSNAVLRLGNLDAKRDWGHAKDYVRAMVMMLQYHEADDFIIATGITHSVRYCVEQSFAVVGIPIVWSGSGLQEKGINALTGDICVTVDPQLFRPCEVDLLCGDATKAQTLLGWKPRITFEQMIMEMVQYDYSELQKKHILNRKETVIAHEYTNNNNTQFFDHGL